MLGLNKILYVKEKFPSVRSYNINCSVVFCLKGSRANKHLFHDRKAQLEKNFSDSVDMYLDRVRDEFSDILSKDYDITEEVIVFCHRVAGDFENLFGDSYSYSNALFGIMMEG